MSAQHPGGLPPEIRRVFNEGVRIHPGVWRQRVVELWGDLMVSTHPRAAKRRVSVASYAGPVYALARQGRVKPGGWSMTPAYRCHTQSPHIQGFPKRLKTNTGRGLRDAVVPDDGCVFVDLDFRCSHPWFIAGLTGDERLLEDLEAQRVYPSVMEALGVTRDSAKVLVLALTNGGGRPAIMDELLCTEKEAGEALDKIAALFPGLAKMPRERAWVTPALQRPVIMSDDVPEHAAVGWRLQSAEADAIILALRELTHLRVVMQVHDQLLIEAPIDQAPAVLEEAREVMNRALRKVAGLPNGDPNASVSAEIVPSWSGAVPDLKTADPGGELELPAGPVSDEAWCAREALQRVLDGVAELPDLHRSPWLLHLAGHEDLLSRLTPKTGAARVRTASKAAAKGAEAAAQRDRQAAREAERAPSGGSGGRLGGKEGADLREAAGAPSDWPTYTIPPSWEVGEDGSILRIVREEGEDEASRKLVAHEPWYVLRALQDYDTGRSHLEIGFRHHNRWQRRVVQREVLRSTTKIVDLAAEGVDVRSTSSKNAVDWASYCEPRSGAASVVTSRTGWHDETYIQGPGGAIELNDPNQERTGWVARGTWGGWQTAVRPIVREPLAALLLAAAAIGPLLPWLDLGFCPVIDISGPHCTGKTTALKVAGSGWGCPDEGAGNMIRTWDSTLTGLERTAASVWHAPLLLDETGRIANVELLRAAVYALVQGRGKARGTPGSMQRTATWENVIISSGESPLVSYSEAGGARGRPLSITATPAISSLEVAQQIERGLSEHYGHLAPRLAEEALKVGDGLQRKHRDALARWHAEVGGDTRMLSTAAAIEVAAGVLIGMGIPLGGWMAELRRAAGGSSGLADQSGRALDIVREELGRNRARYHGQELMRVLSTGGYGECRVSEPVPPVGGYRGVWRDNAAWVGIFPEVLREVLVSAKHEPEPVLVKWEQDGTLLPGTKGRKRQAKIDGKGVVVYAFAASKLWPDGDGDLE